MKQMIIWQYLPRDLLHCVYSEWLTWSDLSALDIACLSHEDREEWLTSLSCLVMGEACQFFHALLNNKLVKYYQWLDSRKVLVRDQFPLRLSVLEDFLRYCDPVTFCPALHSIKIVDEKEKPAESYDILRAEYSLSYFLSHCSHLEEVRVNFDNCKFPRQDNILYTALNNQIQDNKLVKVDLRINTIDEVINEKISSLLSKHVDSLKELRINDPTKDCSGLVYVLENLIKSKHALHMLKIVIGRRADRDPILLLLQYLSTAGMFLKKLSLSFNVILTNEILLLIGLCCPNLEQLSWIANGAKEMFSRMEIYRRCPYFKCLSTNDFIMDANEDKKILGLFFFHIYICANLEDVMECVLLSLQRGKYRELKLSVVFGLELEQWRLVATKVGSRLTSLSACMSHDELISILPDLPRLQELDVELVGTFSGRSLAIIAEHGQKLIKLCIGNNDGLKIAYNDETICAIIRSCKELEELAFAGAGCESILCVAQHLPRLRNVKLSDVRANRAEIASLLCGEEVRWPSCLRVGDIRGDGFRFKYMSSSRSWVEVK